MKALIVVAAAALAFPVYAQQKSDTKTDTTLPNAQERAQNRDKVATEADKAKEKLPTADERAKNRETVSSGAAGAALTTKVKSALAADAGLKTMTSIDVDSKDGVVTLKGKVDSADLKKKAGDVAKKVSGVKSVKNELKVEKKS
ncbi:MAG TPA: BON domain-containing protein [Burkholderiales bacterium]